MYVSAKREDKTAEIIVIVITTEKVMAIMKSKATIVMIWI